MYRATLVLAASCIVSVVLNAQTSPSLPKDAEALQKSYQDARQRALQPLDQKYKTELDKLLAAHTKAGRLDAAIAIRNEITRISGAAGGSPTSADTGESGAVQTADGDILRSGHRYRFIKTALVTWLEADEQCKKLGGHLVSIENKGEWEAMLKLGAKSSPGQNWWIGLRRPDGQLEPFTWTDETKYDFKVWPAGPKPPSMLDATRPYVLVVVRTEIWTVYNATTKAYFVCEWDKP